ncbi:peroxisomal 2 4-dienoyl-CoA reductase sps19 [Coniosporium apollinis]|uniref:2,4-dienoyl-CoA reductase [(3E)-enoyl-CoA-producing] n=1 Tax=Coniosporium apollinis TaxID=61459 RepID=A0ABQ9NV40_9PEZI|nr:peroxisomal 2 4-dienoyl-CoA reductase sps19 [Coniosporium apollinis]
MPIPKSEYLSEVWKDDIFNNKVVFCTGGAGTICSAQVRALVHLGADACILGRNVEKTERMAQDIATARKGARVLGLGAVDVRDAGAMGKAAERCVQELGGIDFVIAGAAGNFLAPIAQLSPNAFKSVMDIDVLGSYNTVKATLPYLLKSAAAHKTDGKTPPKDGTGGRIIFVSATIHYAGAPLQTHVSVAKAGVDALSAAVCIEQGPRGVTSNVIAPGPIAGTEGMERLLKSGEEARKASEANIPSGRWGTVREIADATVYLFGDAGSYVNGEILVVDGGSWHTGMQPGAGFKYPDFLLSDEVVTGVKGVKGEKQSKL